MRFVWVRFDCVLIAFYVLRFAFWRCSVLAFGRFSVLQFSGLRFDCVLIACWRVALLRVGGLRFCVSAFWRFSVLAS